jgi:hypothetical protein
LSRRQSRVVVCLALVDARAAETATKRKRLPQWITALLRNIRMLGTTAKSSRRRRTCGPSRPRLALDTANLCTTYVPTRCTAALARRRYPRHNPSRLRSFEAAQSTEATGPGDCWIPHRGTQNRWLVCAAWVDAEQSTARALAGVKKGGHQGIVVEATLGVVTPWRPDTNEPVPLVSDRGAQRPRSAQAGARSSPRRALVAISRGHARGRGRDDYPVRATWNALLAGILF